MKTAFITGLTGMDGSHLADLLLSKGYKVHGLVRRHSSADPWRIKHIMSKVVVHSGDLLDQAGLANTLSEVQPDEVYNMAAQSFVKDSFSMPVYTSQVTGIGALNLFEAVRCTCLPATRIYQASSSEMFGNTKAPQNEDSPMQPVSPYGVAKLFAHRMAKVYRDSYGMFISCGISYNHESERRGQEFVTRKITMAAARIKAGLQDKLELGNLAPKRDWSYAPDVVNGAWLSLQHEEPGDYVFSSGESHTVSEFVREAFHVLGLDPDKFIVSATQSHVRPTEIWDLVGDCSKAKRVLGWEPTLTFKELIARMVAYDLSNALINTYSLQNQN